MLGLGLSLRSQPLRSSGGGVIPPDPVYDADAQAYFARRSVQPNAAYKGFVNDTVVALKAAGFWARLEGLYLARDPVSRADARLNLKGAAYPLTEVGSLTFTSAGFKGDGTTGYLNTGFAFPAGMQNSSHVGLETPTEGQSDAYDASANTGVLLQVYSLTAKALIRLHTATNTIISDITTAVGHHIVSRTAAGASALYRNGTLVSTSAAASAAPLTDTLVFMGRPGNSYSTRVFRVGHFGDGLTAGEVASISNIIKTNYSDKIAALPVPQIASYGDSLTAGSNGGGTTYPGVLANLTGGNVFNGGVPGETAAEIKARWDVDNTRLGRIFICWAGRNDVNNANFFDAIPLIQAMVARADAANGGKSLVVGVTCGWNGSNDIGSQKYNDIASFNNQLATLYGSRFVDLQVYLRSLGAPGAIYDDPTEYALGRIPTALRGDASVHFNGLGYTTDAQKFYEVMANLGWL